ncbi:MAG TPA: hypothetical protein VF960_05900, partial [Chloroflexota bacterium]
KIAASGEPGVRLGAIEALGLIVDPAAVSALGRVASTAPAGEVRKAARRAAHRLASMGIKGEPEQGPAAVPTSDPTGTDFVAVLASPIDGAGNRGIWFGPRRGGDASLVSVLTNDTEGIKDMFAREMSASRFEKEARRVLDEPEYPWIEIPADYGRHLVGVAHRLNSKSHTPLPLDFLVWRERIAIPRTEAAQPIVYSVMSAAEVRWDPRNLDMSANLFDMEMFRGWILDREDLAGFAEEKLTAERSGLLIAGAGGENRDRMIEERAILGLFDARRRELYKGRLEEMAYLLWKLGRVQAARSALAAALALEPPDRSVVDHPFIRALVGWSLEVVTEMARNERTRSIRPGLQLHLP